MNRPGVQIFGGWFIVARFSYTPFQNYMKAYFIHTIQNQQSWCCRQRQVAGFQAWCLCRICSYQIDDIFLQIIIIWIPSEMGGALCVLLIEHNEHCLPVNDFLAMTVGECVCHLADIECCLGLHKPDHRISIYGFRHKWFRDLPCSCFCRLL